jgi:hypothetical protein
MKVPFLREPKREVFAYYCNPEILNRTSSSDKNYPAVVVVVVVVHGGGGKAFQEWLLKWVKERLIKQTIANKIDTGNVDRSAIERNRQAVHKTRKLQGLVYDPDGCFDVSNIKPLSIDTAMLSVGSKSKKFSLKGVQLETLMIVLPAQSCFIKVVKSLSFL